MLVDPPIEKLLPRVENRYTLAITVARRTRQLVDGAQPLVDKADNPNLVTLACKELADDKYVTVPGELEPFIPLRPEVSAALADAAREEDEGEEELTLHYTPTVEEPEIIPASKIRIMDADEVFYMPYEVEDEEEPVEDEEEIDDKDDDVVAKLAGADDDADEIVSDDDLEHIDGSIDDYPEEEDEDL